LAVILKITSAVGGPLFVVRCKQVESRGSKVQCEDFGLSTLDSRRSTDNGLLTTDHGRMIMDNPPALGKLAEDERKDSARMVVGTLKPPLPDDERGVG